MAKGRYSASAYERSIVRDILKVLNGLDECVCRKLHGGAYTTTGDPDLYGCFKGSMFVFEAKAPGGKVTKMQRYRLEQWAKAGAITGVVRCTGDALRLLGLVSGDVGRSREETAESGVDSRVLAGGRLTCIDEKYAAQEIDPNLQETDGYIPINNRDDLAFRAICPYCRTVTDFVRPELSARGKMYLYTCWDCDGEQVLNLSEVARYLQKGDRKRTRREKPASTKPGPARRKKKRKEQT
jgi:hypothetical protein